MDLDLKIDLRANFSQLALEEEDVWRAVLNWAKYQTGVTQPTAHWTEEERVRVCQQLTGVINHVRLLLIGRYCQVPEIDSRCPSIAKRQYNLLCFAF